MNKRDEIELRHKFEANLRHAGFNNLALTFLGNYEDPQIQAMWAEVKLRGEVNEH